MGSNSLISGQPRNKWEISCRCWDIAKISGILTALILTENLVDRPDRGNKGFP